MSLDSNISGWALVRLLAYTERSRPLNLIPARAERLLTTGSPALPLGEVILRRRRERPWCTEQRIAVAGNRRNAGDRQAGRRIGPAAARPVERQRAGTGRLGQLRVSVGRRQIEGQRLQRLVEHLDFSAFAPGLAEIGRELFAATRQIHVLLDVLPVDVKDTGINLQPMVQEGVLGADFIAPQTVGPELSRHLALTTDYRESERGEIPAADETHAH